MAYRKRLIWLGVLALLCMVGYMTLNLQGALGYVIPRRFTKLAAMLVTSVAIGVSTLIFQTVTMNRILTPNVIGLDSLYMLLQTGLLFLFGSSILLEVGIEVRFVATILLMVGFAIVLYQLLFRGEGRNVYFLLLVGLVFGTFFGSITSFLQLLMDPNEFQLLQDRSFASINNVDSDLLMLATVLLVLNTAWLWRYVLFLDVLALGRDHAINLGIPYEKIVKRLLIIVAIYISIATALIGPITFLGLLIVNVAYQLIPTYRHHALAVATVLLGVIALVGGQLIVEHVLNFSTTLSVILNLIGGSYFIYLLLKGVNR